MRFTFRSRAALFGAIGCFFMACSDTDSKTEEMDLAVISGSHGKDSTGKTDSKRQRQFVRTADIEFKVKDVRRCSEQIEELALKYGGFVSFAHIQSTVTDKKSMVVNQDSLLEMSLIKVTSNIGIRVPHQYLQSFLKDLNGMMLFVDYQTVRVEDVSLSMLSHDWARYRQEKFVERNQQVHKNRKGNINVALEAEKALLNYQMKADGDEVQKLSLQNRVDLSTITINIYQSGFIDRTVVENTEKINRYRTNFFVRIQDSFIAGWVYLEDVIVVLLRLWVVVLFVGMIGWYYISKKKTSKPIW